MIVLVLIVLAAICIMAYFVFIKALLEIVSNWRQFLDQVQFSITDFYAMVENALKQSGIPDISVGRESFKESHVLSAKRQYLKVSFKEYVFYVGAAPFAEGTFVSWWCCVKEAKPHNKIPVVSRMMGKDRSGKTFYQMDTETMFIQAVHAIVLAAVDSMGAEKGMRGLTDLQRQYSLGSK